MAAPTSAARVKKALANPEPSTHGLARMTWAFQQVVGHLGYTDRASDVVARKDQAKVISTIGGSTLEWLRFNARKTTP